MAVRRIIILTVIALTLAGVPAANAGTTWQTFGSGTATGRGDYGYPSVDVESTTGSDPSRVRFQITGDPVRFSLSWNITCWSEGPGYGYEYASGSRKITLPYTLTASDAVGNLAPFDYCSLEVSVYRFNPGHLTVKLSATY